MDENEKALRSLENEVIMEAYTDTLGKSVWNAQKINIANNIRQARLREEQFEETKNANLRQAQLREAELEETKRANIRQAQIREAELEEQRRANERQAQLKEEELEELRRANEEQARLRLEELEETRTANRRRERIDFLKFLGTAALMIVGFGIECYTVHSVTRKEKVYQEPFLTRGDQAIVNNALKNKTMDRIKF